MGWNLSLYNKSSIKKRKLSLEDSARVRYLYQFEDSVHRERVPYNVHILWGYVETTLVEFHVCRCFQYIKLRFHLLLCKLLVLPEKLHTFLITQRNLPFSVSMVHGP